MVAREEALKKSKARIQEEIKNQELIAKIQAEERKQEEREDPAKVAQRQKQAMAIQNKINEGIAGAAIQQQEERLPPAINDVVINHTKWLRKKLYDSRERNGDVIFVFYSGAQVDEIEIPVPQHSLN